MKHPAQYTEFKDLKLEQIFFLDIETVALAPSMETLDKPLQLLWEKKAQSIATYSSKYSKEPHSTDPAYIYRAEAGIHSEFSKIICLSVGVLRRNKQSDKEDYEFHVTSFHGSHEPTILEDFFLLLEHNHNYCLCAHNGMDFDFPFICRRAVIQNLSLPASLQILGKKPWETKWLLDTMQLWTFMGKRNFVSLDTLTYSLNLPSPKKISNSASRQPPSNMADESVSVAASDINEQTSDSTSTVASDSSSVMEASSLDIEKTVSTTDAGHSPLEKATGDETISPDDDEAISIDGSMIHDLYYDEARQTQNLELIREYCQQDTLAIAQIFLRLREKPIIPPNAVFVKDFPFVNKRRATSPPPNTTN